MPQSNRKSESYRRAMLGMVHIAKKDLCLDDGVYREIISTIAPGKSSSADLNNGQLSMLLKHFEGHGFRAKAQGSRRRAQGKTQIQALKEKAQAMLDRAVEYSFVRHPRQLVFKYCQVDDIRFCSDAKKLKQLIAVIGHTEPVR